MGVYSTSQKNVPRLLWWYYQRRASDRPTTAIAGFSLLEVLVAMIVASVAMVLITPPIFMVTAARVQQRRAQQSQQVAQAEMDRVRTTVERGVFTVDDLPVAVNSALNTIPAPTSVHGQLKSTTQSCNAYTGDRLDSAVLLPVDVNGDCQSDFLLQSFRTTGPAGTSVPVSGFRMMVRVYADIPQLRSNLGQLSVTPASLSFSSGVSGTARQPLTVLQSTIVRPDTGTSLRDYSTVCTNVGC